MMGEGWKPEPGQIPERIKPPAASGVGRKPPEGHNMTVAEAASGVAFQLHILLIAVRSAQIRAADEATEALTRALAHYGEAIACRSADLMAHGSAP